MNFGRCLVVSLVVSIVVSIVVGGAVALHAEEPAVNGGVEAIQADINTAIDRGVSWLLEQQLADGSWGQAADRYPGGMTGLALYTLLKSGVPAEHPCVRLGFANLLSLDPQETYSLSCQLMALGAAGDPTHHPRMKALGERLLSWQVRGSWSYPWAHEGPGWADKPGKLDLSNGQFAVLGLRAARAAGVEVPRKVLHDIIRQTRFHQQIPRDAGGDDAEGGARKAAGFAYHGPGEQRLGVATGSMTCAGVTVLEVCRRMLGKKLSGKHARQIDEAIRHALVWLDENWSVQENPSKKQYKLYYLYGLERVGSLLGRKKIGSHDWYAEGARELLATQKKGGEWGSASATSFGLLFLLRATKGEVTGEGRAPSVFPTYANDQGSPLRIRAEGHSPMKLWITSIDPDTIARHGTNGRIQFDKVEYVVDDRVEITAAQGPPPHGADPTHRATIHFPHAGKFKVKALGHVNGPHGEVVLESTPFEVEVKFLVQPWAFDEAAWASRNLLRRGEIEVEGSSHNNDHQIPAKAVDGHTQSYWVCQPKPPDPRPTLQLAPRKPIKANRIVLAPVLRRDQQRLQFDRPTGFEIVVNGKGAPFVVTPEEDELRPTVLRLPKTTRIKSLEIAIVSRTPGKSWPGESGFREVSLERAAVDRPTFEQESTGRVVLACTTRGAEIRYTLDGTLPTNDAPLYEGPFTWPGRTRLHAVARLPSGERSRLLVAVVRVPGEVHFR